MKKLLLVAVALAMLAGLSTAAAALSWQTAPVLGTYAFWDGDVRVTTVSGEIFIPYNDDPSYVQGSSMSVFWADPLTGTATVATGSGAYVDPTEDWTVLNYWVDPLGVHQWDWTDTGSGEDFVMAYDTGELCGVGNWTYHEEWSQAGVATITSDTPFRVNAAVPEPMSVLLGIMGLSSIAGFRKLRRK